MFNYAIDLGSSNTVIYKVGYGVVLKEPTLIAIEHNGNKNIVRGVGVKAKKLQNKTNNKIEVISPIEEGIIVNEIYAKLLLKEFLKKINVNTMLKTTKMIFCLPCGLTAQERGMYKKLAYGLNITYAETLASSICALTGMDVDVYDTTTYMMVNIGGGNTDIAVVYNGSIIKGCTINIGGIAMDNAIIAYLKEVHGIVVSKNEAEMVKNEIASLHPKDISHLSVEGIDVNTLEYKSMEVTAKELVPLCSNFFNNIANSIETILNMCNAEIISDISKNGIYFCGGLSKVTALEQFMRDKIKLPIYIDIYPENTVMNGAGILLNDPNKLDRLIKEFN